jgi:hypothetical protein
MTRGWQSPLGPEQLAAVFRAGREELRYPGRRNRRQVLAAARKAMAGASAKLVARSGQ